MKDEGPGTVGPGPSPSLKSAGHALVRDLSHSCDPVAIRQSLLHFCLEKSSAVRRVPASQIVCGDLFPIAHDHDRKSVVQRVDRRALHDGDAAERERFPGAVTVETVPVRADDECEPRLFAPEIESGYFVEL